MSDLNQLVKQKLDQLLNDLNEIFDKKWLLLNNSGLGCLNRISKAFLTMYDDDDEDLKKMREENQINFKPNEVVHEINKEFNSLHGILASFKLILENLKQILQALRKIDEMKTIPGLDVANLDDLQKVYNQYENEYSLKSSLVNHHLFECRTSNDELLALTAYWMHEPCIDIVLLAKLKYFIKNFQ
jgi:hypothetical protein